MINRDTYVAVFLLLFCGLFIAATFYIRDTTYGTMQASVWPRIILVVMTLFSMILLAQAQRQPRDEGGGGGIVGWFRRYRNPLICYTLFFVFLITLPILGLLLGGTLFVFAMLTVLGQPTLARVPLHATIAITSVGAMWAIFTFGLNVFLPRGMIMPF